MAFGVGATGEAVYLGLFNTFITIYYNQVMELNNALIGIAIMLAMIGSYWARRANSASGDCLLGLRYGPF